MFRKNAFQRRVSRRFYVTPKAGVNFSGVLVRSDGHDDGHSVFADVKVHQDGREPESVVGELYIRNNNVAYVQEMPHVDA